MVNSPFPFFNLRLKILIPTDIQLAFTEGIAAIVMGHRGLVLWILSAIPNEAGRTGIVSLFLKFNREQTSNRSDFRFG